MTNQTTSLYDTLVFKYSKWVLAVFAIILLSLSQFSNNFRLDASSDSLVLENDTSLKYFREVVAKYNTGDLLLVTYSPKADLFSDEVLGDIKQLRDELAQFENVTSVLSIVDVPLIQSPPVSLAELATGGRNLLDEDTDRSLAEKEFLNSDLYKDLLVSPDRSTTAIALSLKGDSEVSTLLTLRDELRAKAADTGLNSELAAQLESVTLEHQRKAAAFQARQSLMIEEVRQVIAQYQDRAQLFLGGLPMIVADSVSFIQADVVVFGVAALAVIILILTIAFRQLGWVVMPLITVGVTGYLMVCLMGLLNWPISVVSSNFLSLLAIITLSLNIHLIVRYRELAKLNPDYDQRALLSETVRSKFIPCVYTALTTIVAFASLIVSGIRPVIDFGWIMCLGILVAVITTFTVFPALSIMMKPRAVTANKDPISRLILAGAKVLHTKGVMVSAGFIVAASLAGYGVANLTVENRFIDYFKPDTEIYKGMLTIDQELGGTTPLDIILDAPASFFEQSSPAPMPKAAIVLSVEDMAELDEDFAGFEDDFSEESLGSGSEEGEYLDDFDDFEDDFSEGGSTVKSKGNLAATSYWFNVEGINKIKAIQKSLDAMPATGKVMSLATTMSIFENIKDAKPLNNIDLGFNYNVLSDEIKETLFVPYLSEDGNQVHINIRVFETQKGLDRNQLITDIREMLISEHGLADEQVNISGMLVLYNNMLNSLFSSQIATLGTVFLVIFLMFIVLFQSVKLALITIVPNVFSAGVVLGIMGIFSIPLDLMTITIAAISVGIAVDNSIHFVHRFRDEFAESKSYRQSIDVATNNIGQAMFYTTIVITAGFLIMVFSNFVPTMYFGVLTGIAMVTALIANLIMLPMLITKFRPVKA